MKNGLLALVAFSAAVGFVLAATFAIAATSDGGDNSEANDGGPADHQFIFLETNGSTPATPCDDGRGIIDQSDGNKIKFCANGLWVNLSSTTPVEDFGGYSDLVASEETPFAAHIAQMSGTGDQLVFTTNLLGTLGGSSAVLEVLQDSTQLCTLTIDCGTVAGTITTAACPGAISAGATIKFQWDATGACTTLPKGNAELSWK